MKGLALVQTALASDNMAAIALIEKIKENIVNPLITLMFAVALLFFLWGVLQMVMGGMSETAVTDGKKHMIWGVFGMAIMFGAFSIMNMICATISC